MARPQSRLDVCCSLWMCRASRSKCGSVKYNRFLEDLWLVT